MYVKLLITLLKWNLEYTCNSSILKKHISINFSGTPTNPFTRSCKRPLECKTVLFVKVSLFYQLLTSVSYPKWLGHSSYTTWRSKSL